MLHTPMMGAFDDDIYCLPICRALARHAPSPHRRPLEEAPAFRNTSKNQREMLRWRADALHGHFALATCRYEHYYAKVPLPAKLSPHESPGPGHKLDWQEYRRIAEGWHAVVMPMAMPSLDIGLPPVLFK